MGDNECGKSGHLSIFIYLKHLMMLLKCNYSGLHFYTLSKTLISCRAVQLRCFKVETLLNNTFTALHDFFFIWTIQYFKISMYINQLITAVFSHSPVLGIFFQLYSVGWKQTNCNQVNQVLNYKLMRGWALHHALEKHCANPQTPLLSNRGSSQPRPPRMAGRVASRKKSLGDAEMKSWNEINIIT